MSSSSNILIDPREGRELNHVTFHDQIHDLSNHELVIVNNSTPNDANLPPMSVHCSPSKLYGVSQQTNFDYSPSYYQQRHQHVNSNNYQSLSRRDKTLINGRLDLIQTPLQVQIDNSDAIENHNFHHNSNDCYQITDADPYQCQNLAYNQVTPNNQITNADIITCHPYNEQIIVDSYSNQYNNQENSVGVCNGVVNYDTLRRTQRSGILINQTNSASSSSNNSSNNTQTMLTSSSLSTTSSSLSANNQQQQSKSKPSLNSSSKPSVSFANDCSYINLSSPEKSSTLDV